MSPTPEEVKEAVRLFQAELEQNAARLAEILNECSYAPRCVNEGWFGHENDVPRKAQS